MRPHIPDKTNYLRYLVRFLRLSLYASFIASCAAGMLLIVPPIYIEINCAGRSPEDQVRQEERVFDRRKTVSTLPRHHIAFFYADMAESMDWGGLHTIDFLEGIRGYWQSTCAALPVGPNLHLYGSEERLGMYLAGMGFTIDLFAKSIYEKSVGKIVENSTDPDKSPVREIEKRTYEELSQFLRYNHWSDFDWQERLQEFSDLEKDTGISDRVRAAALRFEWSIKKRLSDLVSPSKEMPMPDMPVVHITWIGEVHTPTTAGAVVEPVGERLSRISFGEREALSTGVLEVLRNNGLITEINGEEDLFISVLSRSKPILPEGSLIAYRVRRPSLDGDRYVVRVRVRALSKLVGNLALGGDKIEKIL